ncbi:MAG: penicillin acylase family protein [Candidatus Promineifilaceae bacterium]|nr:penicillin acylase family protein [Candidatus Promineifilaceae bacterium]
MRKKRTITVTLTLLLAAVLGLSLFGLYVTRAPLPEHQGQIAVEGLTAPVDVSRDSWGVPHIYAANAEDLFFAQGYTHAQDRWWQMEFSRQYAHGRLIQLVGKVALAQDLQVRALGLRRTAQRELALYDDETLGYLQAFANGVNAYIMNRPPHKLAAEYALLTAAGLDLTVTPWTPVDTLVYGKIVSLPLSANYTVEQDMSAFHERVGAEMTADFFPAFPYDQKPTIIDAGELGQLTAATAKAVVPFGGGSAQALLPPQLPGIGSNSWVVDGRFTQSGLPLLANDPHLAISLPSVWYEVGLHCRPVGPDFPFDVTGFTFPPFPGVALGHNRHIAWGATVAGPDVQDLYRLRVDAANPHAYQWDGHSRQMAVYEELFLFADGREPLRLTMRETHLGPIVNDYPFDPARKRAGPMSDEPLALRWTALEPGTFFQAIFGLNAATNWQEFREALAHWDFGSMNMIYADTAGNIGYQMPGRVPIRTANHDGLTPAPGWTSDYEWRGLIPYDLLPRLFNPEDGYIVTANQNIMPPAYWEQLAEALGSGMHYNFHEKWFVYGYRAQRIEQLLLAGRPHTVASFTDLQMDNKLISAAEMAPYLARLKPETAELAAARDWLLAWDQQLDRESGQAALYMQFWRLLLENLYNDTLTAYELPPASDMHMWPTTRLLAEPENPWWDDLATPERVERRDDVLLQTLRQAHDLMVDSQGADRTQWRWGDLHTATFVNQPLGSLPVLKRIVNRGPLAVDGGNNVVNATGQVGPWGDDPFAVNGLPSMRMVVDLSQLENSVSINSTGQSGHLWSTHYDDMIEAWRDGRVKPMGLPAAETLQMVPANQQ